MNKFLITTSLTGVLICIFISIGCETTAKVPEKTTYKLNIDGPENRIFNIKIRRLTKKEKDESNNN